jgi:hypothetical protein
MAWEALTGIAAVASALILLVGSVAAILQLRDLRLANQLGVYIQLIEQMQSADIVDARKYIETRDFNDPAVLQAAISPSIDPRIVALGVHLQSACRMLNLGLLDDELFFIYSSIAPQVWIKLAPIARALREREGTPRWIDIEYLVYRASKNKHLIKMAKRYEPSFLAASGLGRQIEVNQERVDAAATLPGADASLDL